MKRACVFAGSNMGTKSEYQTAAKELGKVLAKHGLELVYGGSSVGLMGIVADAVLEQGGTVIGVMPTFLSNKELAHKKLNHFYETEDMHDRKAKMGELSDAFIALPGGFGTFEELFEVISWGQLRIHQKPIGLLNVAGYYEPLVHMVHKAMVEGFIHPEDTKLFICESDPFTLVEKLFAYQPPDPVLKWKELAVREAQKK